MEPNVATLERKESKEGLEVCGFCSSSLMTCSLVSNDDDSWLEISPPSTIPRCGSVLTRGKIQNKVKIRRDVSMNLA